jgi:tetratricopeptide (TPR) repeat protein
VVLRLAIGPAGLGLELDSPVRLGCARVVALASALPNTRFPVDVSGGVSRFRHRLGALRLVEVEISAPAFERWAAPRLRGVVGSRIPDVWVQVRPAAATICVADATDPERSATDAAAVLAFDVCLLAAGDDLALVVTNARGADLPAPAPALAIACVDALVGGVATRAGSLFVLRSAARTVGKALFPQAGARSPSADDVCWNVLGAEGASWVLQAEGGALEVRPTDEAVLAREVAVALREADEALLAGASDDARRACLVALEHAPRHPEIVRRLLGIDSRVAGRAEAALATLAELRPADRSPAYGTVPAELLLQRGDVDAALASLDRAAESEVAPALAAKAFEIAARRTRDPEVALRWLDRALASAPRSCTARWARVEKRLAVGRLEEARADVEHLEALARGPRAKHAVWVRAGRLWRGAGLAGRAAVVFERALRFVPDEPDALAGLGAALLAEGQHARGVALLTRALDLLESAPRPSGAVALDLAIALAEKLGDVPRAIARASAVAADTPEAPAARGLEGRWRASLGDFAGAGLAFARMREGVASRASLEGLDAVPSGPRIVQLLQEAAHMERKERNDPIAAQRYLAEALRLRPQDEMLRSAFRDVCAAVAGTRAPAGDGDKDKDTEADAEPAIDPEARVELLTRRLHADPSDDAVADELAALLERLDRGHELLALLSGRLEDATPARRAVLAPRARTTLERLASQAAHDGREVEADLFRTAAASLRE